MKEAIQKAIEGGWKPTGYGKFSDNAISYKVQAVMKIKYKERIFLDPLFWKALGKSLGWDELEDGRKWESAKFGFMPVCKYRWHCFIDHLADGKSAESFFEELLPPSQE